MLNLFQSLPRRRPGVDRRDALLSPAWMLKQLQHDGLLAGNARPTASAAVPALPTHFEHRALRREPRLRGDVAHPARELVVV